MDFDKALQGPGFVKSFEVLVLDGCSECSLQEGVCVTGEGVVDVNGNVIKASELGTGEAAVAVDDNEVRFEVHGVIGMGCDEGIPGHDGEGLDDAHLGVGVRGKLEPLRAKMTRLADRGWLHKRPDGRFTARR